MNTELINEFMNIYSGVIKEANNDMLVSVDLEENQEILLIKLNNTNCKGILPKKFKNLNVKLKIGA